MASLRRCLPFVGIHLVVLPGGVTAQTTTLVDPPLFRYLAGARATSYPFGSPSRRSVRDLEVRDGLAGQARSIKGIGMRRSFGSTAKVSAFNAVCTVRLGTATVVASKISATFSKNMGADVTKVLDARRVSFAVSEPKTNLPAFEYRLPFLVPFAFKGTGSLVIDLAVASHTNATAFTFDLYQEGRAYSAAFGQSCGGTDLATTLTTGKITHDTTGLPAGAPVLFLAGLPLLRPLDLTALGAPGCENLVSFPVILPGFADSKGAYSISFASGSAKAGDHYACQVMAVKPGVNKLGAVFSQANLVLPIAARDTARVFASSSTATTGTAQPVFGLVLEIQ